MAALDGAVLETIYAAARAMTLQAGELLAGAQTGGIGVRYKDERRSDPVTDSDTASETLLRTAIAARFPSHAVLGEEGGQTEVGTGQFVWALDPLDGTANYAAGLPIFAVSVAVLLDGAPVVGCIGVPAMGLLYHAAAGLGAWLGDRPLRASTLASVGRSAPVGLFSGWRAAFTATRWLRRRPGEPRSTGSIAAELGLVAAGSLQYAVYATPKVWDVAAGALIVREAGGSALCWQRRPGWRPLDRFVADDEGGLRAWSRPTLVGGNQLVPLVAAELAPRPRGRAWPRPRA